MRDSPRTLGRRDALRAGVGLATATAAAVQPATAQNTTDGNETAENRTAPSTNETDGTQTAGNGTETAADEPSEPTGNDTTETNDSAGMETANGTAETAGSDGGTTGAGGLSVEGVTAVFLGLLAAALLSPLVFALLMKVVYDDETPEETTHEYRPE